MTPRPHLRPPPLLLLAVTVGVIGVPFLGACSTPLLSPEEERSQYDRYDAVRNQYASQYKEDEFGQRRPNLKARLSPKE